MIRCGNQIRLNAEDLDWLFRLTGRMPIGIRSVDDLNNFVNLHLPNYSNGTLESELLKVLLVDRKISSEK